MNAGTSFRRLDSWGAAQKTRRAKKRREEGTSPSSSLSFFRVTPHLTERLDKHTYWTQLE